MSKPWSGLQVTDPALIAAYESLLLPSESEEVASAPSPELRRERLLSRALVRATLARYCTDPCRHVLQTP